MTYRVIQWSTGNVGQAALRCIIRHPELELAGVWVHSAAKVGRDAGELCGLPPTGVHATDDAEALLALDADCVCYTATADLRPQEAITDMARILRAGKNVVSSSAVAMVWPRHVDAAMRAPLDDAGRRLLKEIHERSIHELEEILSDDLRKELTEVTLPFASETPTDAELRIAQAQLVGWLEGLFHGIQATLFTQQMQAQRQFEEMRQRRALDGGQPEARTPGAYL